MYQELLYYLEFAKHGAFVINPDFQFQFCDSHNFMFSLILDLHLIFTSIVQSVITYALPPFAGQLSKSDKSSINALFHKALKCGLCNMPLDIEELIITADKRLFHLIFNETHCLHHIPPQHNVHTVSSLRTHCHNFTLLHTDFNLHKNTFINHCLFQCR